MSGSFNGLDIVLLALIIGVGVVGMVRGFGRTALDALGLYAALWAASAAAPLVAGHISLHAGPAAVNRSWALGLLLLLSGAAALGVAWYAYGMTQFHAGMFDKLLGLAAGLGGGMIVAHALVATLVTADPRCVASAAQVASGTVGTEMYSFPAYHAVMDTITGAKTYMRDVPAEAGR